MKKILFLFSCLSVSAFIIAGCKSATVESTEWLAANAGKSSINITGTWKDTNPNWGWGSVELRQKGNKITGTMDSYNVKGVVNGNKIYLALYERNSLYYSHKLVYNNNKLTGQYFDYLKHNTPRSNVTFKRVK